MTDPDMNDELLRCSNFRLSHTDGLRDVVIGFDAHDGQAWRNVELMVEAKDAAVIAAYINSVRASAWRNGRRPADALPGETAPVVLSLRRPMMDGDAGA